MSLIYKIINLQKGFFACMCQHVILENIRIGERLATCSTGKWSLVCMGSVINYISKLNNSCIPITFHGVYLSCDQQMLVNSICT